MLLYNPHTRRRTENSAFVPNQGSQTYSSGTEVGLDQLTAKGLELLCSSPANDRAIPEWSLLLCVLCLSCRMVTKKYQVEKYQ